MSVDLVYKQKKNISLPGPKAKELMLDRIREKVDRDAFSFIKLILKTGYQDTVYLQRLDWLMKERAIDATLEEIVTLSAEMITGIDSARMFSLYGKEMR